MPLDRFAERRLDRLETLLIIRPVCPTCSNHPSRLVGIDEVTDEQTSETAPESGCPSCGRVPFRTIELVGIDVTEL
jgi:hypothetical protein